MVVRLSMVYKILILSCDIKVTAFDNMKNDNEYVVNKMMCKMTLLPLSALSETGR
jgi:hypothetical protein